MDKKTPRGLRNNNPLNIEKNKGAAPWKGEVIQSEDVRFAQFKTISYGYRAAFKLINNYQKKYGIDTIRKIISRWAPSNENHTENYINIVSKESCISSDMRITTTNKDVMIPIVAAMSFVENGVRPKIKDVEDGWMLFIENK